MTPVDISVVMPAYREAEALRQLLPQLVPAIHKLSNSCEIIVADAMEPLDDTPEICAAHGVRHILREGGNSYGDAVRTGIRHSAGQRVLLMDADGSHNPRDISRLWEAREDSDIVIGSRYVRGGNTENPAVLIWMSRVLNYMYRLAFGLRVKDISNSFRLYRGEQLRSLKLVSNNFDIVEEILIRLVFGSANATAIEVPVIFEQRKAGESKRDLPAFMLSYLRSISTLKKFRAEELKKKRRGR